MARKFLYRGKTIEDLQKMSLDEFVALMPSKARRTIKRMGIQIKATLAKIRRAKTRGKQLRTHNRQMVVLPEMVGMTLMVHDGKTFQFVNVVPEMLGHRLGEYSITCKLVKHSGPGIGATRGSKAVELK